MFGLIPIVLSMMLVPNICGKNVGFQDDILLAAQTTPRNLGRPTFVALILTAWLVSISGCAHMGGTSLSEWWHNDKKVGPNYCRPPAPVAEGWIDQGTDIRIMPAPAEHRAWWTTFQDPVIDRLVVEAYQQNLSLREAGLRVLQARSQLAISQGNLFPQRQEAFGEYQHVQVSRNLDPPLVPTTFPPAFAPGARAFDFWSTGFNLAWEVDVWGRFRRNIEAANAVVDATVEDYDAILVCLLADTVATYTEIRTLEQRLDYARSNVEIQQGSLDLADARFQRGAVSELDVTQAKSNLAQTESLIPGLESSLRQANNRLCILLGVPARDLLAELGPAMIPTAPPEVAVGIPAELLRRRPDVRAAERRAAAQSASIGVAVSDLYPAFTVLGTINYEAEKLSNLFDTSSLAGNVGPTFRWNVLNYGRIRNNIILQDARFQELVVRYQNSVLRAGQEVEDALIAFLKAQEQTRSLRESVKAANRSVEIAEIQYREGAIDFNRVFSLQSLLVSQQDQLASAEGNIAASLIRVYKALGGGWQIRCARLPVVIANADVPVRLP